MNNFKGAQAIKVWDLWTRGYCYWRKYGLFRQFVLYEKSRVNNNSVCTLKKTQHFTITKINLFMLFKKIIPACTENHTKPINTKCTFSEMKQVIHIFPTWL
jgi:hypothetical protein